MQRLELQYDSSLEKYCPHTITSTPMQASKGMTSHRKIQSSIDYRIKNSKSSRTLFVNDHTLVTNQKKILKGGKSSKNLLVKKNKKNDMTPKTFAHLYKQTQRFNKPSLYNF